MLSCSCDIDGASGERLRTARKPHKCGECGGDIKPGEEYWFMTFFGEGTASNFKCCDKCHDLGESMEELGFCWYWGSLLDMHAEYLDTYQPQKIESAAR